MTTAIVLKGLAMRHARHDVSLRLKAGTLNEITEPVVPDGLVGAVCEALGVESIEDVPDRWLHQVDRDYRSAWMIHAGARGWLPPAPGSRSGVYRFSPARGMTLLLLALMLTLTLTACQSAGYRLSGMAGISQVGQVSGPYYGARAEAVAPVGRGKESGEIGLRVGGSARSLSGDLAGSALEVDGYELSVTPVLRARGLVGRQTWFFLEGFGGLGFESYSGTLSGESAAVESDGLVLGAGAGLEFGRYMIGVEYVTRDSGSEDVGLQVGVRW